jgi:hypothetical protein
VWQAVLRGPVAADCGPLQVQGLQLHQKPICVTRDRQTSTNTIVGFFQVWRRSALPCLWLCLASKAIPVNVQASSLMWGLDAKVSWCPARGNCRLHAILKPTSPNFPFFDPRRLVARFLSCDSIAHPPQRRSL